MSDNQYEIYAITSEWEWYVGKSWGIHTNPARRFRKHMTGSGNSVHLWEAVQQHGQDAFTQVILESGFGDHVAAEQFWYDMGQLFETRKCLNGARPNTWGKNAVHTPEWIEKRTAPQRGIKRTPEQIRVNSEVHKGLHPSDETRKKMSLSNLGKHFMTPEQRQAVSDRQRGTIVKRTYYQCGDCDVITTGGPLATHQKKTSHVGRTYVSTTLPHEIVPQEGLNGNPDPVG